MVLRKQPNILITGTPGVGKSTLCEQLAAATGLRWLNVGDIVKEHECYQGYDEQLQCPILDEDKLLDEMECLMSDGGCIVDYHSCDFFPKRWFNAVFVLRTDNTLLYGRLVKRGYCGAKLDNNIQCEIFQTVLDEARDSYDTSLVHELASNTVDDASANCGRIADWLGQWCASQS